MVLVFSLSCLAVMAGEAAVVNLRMINVNLREIHIVVAITAGV